MPLTERLYEKAQAVLNVPATPSVTPSTTPSVTVTPSVTPSITVSPTISVTPSSTPTVTPTPSVTPSLGIFQLANVYTCDGLGNCGNFTGQATIYNSGTTAGFEYGKFYVSGSTVYQAMGPVAGSVGSSFAVLTYPSYNTCEDACNIVVFPSVSTTPGITVTPSLSATPTASPTPSVTPSVTPSISATPSVTPSVSKTPSVTPSPSS
jgi:hypothetical protein